MTVTSLFLNPLLNIFAVLMESNETKAANESLGNMKSKQAENSQVNLKAKRDVTVSHVAEPTTAAALKPTEPAAVSAAVKPTDAATAAKPTEDAAAARVAREWTPPRTLPERLPHVRR